jgi:hypothetical protein
VLIDATSNLFRRSNEEEIIEHRQILEALVSSLTAYEASDPRDTIYAVLSLAKDIYRGHPGQSPAELLRCLKDRAMGHGLRPEYGKDVFEVCKDFIQSCTHRLESHSLDIIYRHWLLSVTNLPALSKQTDSRRSSLRIKIGCTRGSSLVGYHISRELLSVVHETLSTNELMAIHLLACVRIDQLTTRHRDVYSKLTFLVSRKTQGSVTVVIEQRWRNLQSSKEWCLTVR